MIDPSGITIELTETARIENFDVARRAIDRIRRLGLRFSIDDFGTGYSSLQYLQTFPLNSLKIDGSFIREIGTDSDNREIASAIIAIAHSLDLSVVAEGVETAEQVEFLARQECKYLQGHYRARPMPIESLVKLAEH